jgi:dGTPase
MTIKARRVVRELFAAFMDDPRLMPEEHYESALRAEQDGGAAGRARCVADYVAGMTDRYAILEHGRLFDPAERT